jgi:hypothetical protein
MATIPNKIRHRNTATTKTQTRDRKMFSKNENCEESEIIDCGGKYEVHPTNGGGFAVVNSETGNIRYETQYQETAVRWATEANESNDADN